MAASRFSPFDLAHIDVRHGGRSYGPAVPHVITRHSHPKARPETPDETPAPATGIAYLNLVADAHHQQVAADERIGFHALYSTGQPPPQAGQLPGQLTLDDAPTHDAPTHDAPGDGVPGDGVPGDQAQEARA